MKYNVVIELKSNGWEIQVEGENKVIRKFILEDALEELKKYFLRGDKIERDNIFSLFKRESRENEKDPASLWHQ